MKQIRNKISFVGALGVPQVWTSQALSFIKHRSTRRYWILVIHLIIGAIFIGCNLFSSLESGGTQCARLDRLAVISPDSISISSKITCDGFGSSFQTLGPCYGVVFLTVGKNAVNGYPNLDTSNMKLEVNGRILSEFERPRWKSSDPGGISCWWSAGFTGMYFNLTDTNVYPVEFKLFHLDTLVKSLNFKFVIDSSSFPKIAVEQASDGLRIRIEKSLYGNNHEFYAHTLQSQFSLPYSKLVTGETEVKIDGSNCREIVNSIDKTYNYLRLVYQNANGVLRSYRSDSLVGSEQILKFQISGDTLKHLISSCK